MVLDIPPLSRPSSAARIAAAETLRQLPTRRPEAPRADLVARWELVDVDRYEIREGATVLGYIDVVGAVFVALSGSWYASSVEVIQTLRFEEAIGALRGARPR